jgi:hypothetical protein
MTYYIHHSRMAIPHYACIDESSDNLDNRMTYYRHHRIIAILHHIQVEAHSKYS